MLADIENLEVLKINFNQLKEDYEKDKVDLLVARIEAQTIIRNLLKMKQTTNLSNEDLDKIASLLRDANDLLYKVIDDIEKRNNYSNHNSI